MENLEERARAIEEQLSEEQSRQEDTVKDLVLSDEAQPISLQEIQNKFLQKQVEKGQTLTDISMDFAKAKVTNELMTAQTPDAEKYLEDLAKEQKETIKESFKQDHEKEKTKTLQEKQKKAEAFYTAFRPILEFDFSNLINKEEKTERKPKTYSDRSYGIFLMVGMLLVLTLPYFLVSVVLALFNGINAILEEINTFGKIARYIVLTIVIIFFAVLIVYCTLMGIDHFFGTSILARAGL